nr:reverse transcriptase domain-containing protein [Tanacetum cinerariifolium]
MTTNEFTNFMKANDAILKNMQTNMTSLTNSFLGLKNMFGQFIKMNTASSSGSGTLPGNTITNPKEDLKGITTRSGTTYQGPTILTTSSSLPQVVERETEVTKDTMHPTNNESTKDVQPPIVQVETPMPNSEPIVTPIIELVVAPVSAPKPNQKPLIPYPSRFHDQKLCDKANDQKEKIFQIFQDLNFNISFADALILMPKFGSTIKTLLTNKDKLSELARTPLNEHCSAVLIPCDFSGMDKCLALANLGASINLMPLSMWSKLSLLELCPMCMTLKLVDHLISHPVWVIEDVFVKVGTFYFPANFIVIDFHADPRVPLILRRSFLKTGRALIDVFEGELTLRVGKEAIIFNLDQTSRYSANYNDMTANRIDVINMAFDAFLALEDDPTSLEVAHSYFDTEGDILLEAFLNDDPSLPPPTQGNYLPQVRKELKVCEAKTDKSSIDEPPKVELKDLPPHLEYVILEGDDKFPVIIAKHLSDEEKTALITVLKSHKRAIGWRVCIDYRKLNEATRKDHFPLPFMDQLLKRLARNEYYCFLDGFSGYFQIPIDPKDQEKTTFTCPYEMFAYRRMPFGLCNAPGMFRRYMMVIFHDMIEKMMEVFMDDFLVFGNSFQTCLSYLEKMLKRCEDTNLCLNLEKSHFMVKEGILLSHKISRNGIKVNKAKVDVITKLPHPTTIKGNTVPTKEQILQRCEALLLGRPLFFKSVRVKSSGGVFTAWKPLTFSRLATMDPSGDIMVRTTPPKRKVQLNELNELRDQAYENSLIHKEKTKRLHDSKIKDRVFNIGDRVLLYNFRLKIFSSKLKTRLCGPFTITHVFPYGTVELSQIDGPNFKVNVHRLKHYFGEDIPKMVFPNLQTFPKDQ